MIIFPDFLQVLKCLSIGFILKLYFSSFECLVGIAVLSVAVIVALNKWWRGGKMGPGELYLLPQ